MMISEQKKPLYFLSPELIKNPQRRLTSSLPTKGYCPHILFILGKVLDLLIDKKT
jgi:hypothetical protein